MEVCAIKSLNASRRLIKSDLHTRNIAFTLPDCDSMGEDELYKILGKTELGDVKRVNGQSLDPGVPKYLVRPSSYPLIVKSLPHSVKIVDYGEAFFNTDPPATLRTPLVVRAPEVVLGDKFDHRVDLWSLGCLVCLSLLQTARRGVTSETYPCGQVFELLTGQPPFDVLMLTPEDLLSQMKESATDQLPQRWTELVKRLGQSSSGPEARDGEKNEEATDSQTLQQWLEEVYFNEDKKAELNREDVRKVGDLVGRLLYFEPSLRANASSLLEDPWLK